MKYRIALNFFKLVLGQVNRNFKLFLNEMGTGQTIGFWHFHTPEDPLFLAHWMRISVILSWDRKSYLNHDILPRPTHKGNTLVVLELTHMFVK